MQKIPHFDVITYGEAMAMFVAKETGDLSSITDFTKRAAGAELNVAIGLARLGFNVAWLSKIGNDSLGRFILSLLKKEKIYDGLVRIDKQHPTGFQIKSKMINGQDPEVEYFRKGSAASYLSIQDFSEQHFKNSTHLHLTGVAAGISESSYSLALYLADFMKKLGKTVSFDPNLRPSLWADEKKMISSINQIAFKSDWVLPGITEGKILTGFNSPEKIADFYLEQGVKIVILKLGKDGAYVKDNTNYQTNVPAFLVKNVIDTVGAGDGFAVGVISALLENKSLYQALKRGNKVASFAIQTIGDSEGLPDRQQLDNF
ncbi:sugar kinase [Necropsobacter rosorum]|uniref:sugar kinase n=1 Tax=Necropsobacter rosorum TaxID=908285 RepID=UPI0005096C54